MGFDPSQHFVLTEAPVFSKPVTRYSLQGSLARPSVDPRHGNLQQVSYFVNRKKVLSVLFLSLCGRDVRGIVRRAKGGFLRE